MSETAFHWGATQRSRVGHTAHLVPLKIDLRQGHRKHSRAHRRATQVVQPAVGKPDRLQAQTLRRGLDDCEAPVTVGNGR